MRPFEWTPFTPDAPASLGFSPDHLEAFRQNLQDHATEELLVIRRDQIVCEWYAPEWHAARTHYSASLAKALVGGTSLILALGDSLIHPDHLASHYVPQWRSDPVRSQITIRQLATHSSGLSDARHDVDPADPVHGWQAAFWARDPDPFTISRDRTPILFPPGTRYQYSNPGMAMLAYAVTAALQSSPQPETPSATEVSSPPASGTLSQSASPRDIRTHLRDRAFDPIGLPPAEWSIGYNTPYPVDGLQLWANWGGGSFTARAVARIARLMLRRGDWQGTPLLDPAWVDAALHHASTPLPDREADPYAPASGLCWYTNQDRVWPELPPDAFAGAGAGHQILVAIPSLDLIAVRLGRELEGHRAGHFWTEVHHHLLAPLALSLT
jgi:CubicO group peptidase (beta-lactamase class C family)